MKHKALAYDFSRSIRHYFPEAHYYKIPDAPIYSGSVRIPVYKPYDAYMSYNSGFTAIEFKTWNHKRFKLSDIRDHQVAGLWEVSNSGNEGFFVLCNSEKNNTIYFIRISDWAAFVDILLEENVKSFTFEMLEEYCKYFSCPRTRLPKGYGWDLKTFGGYL